MSSLSSFFNFSIIYHSLLEIYSCLFKFQDFHKFEQCFYMHSNDDDNLLRECISTNICKYNTTKQIKKKDILKKLSLSYPIDVDLSNHTKMIVNMFLKCFIF